MKILMATMGLGIGGAETHIVELVKELKQEGHDVAIVSNGGVYVPEITAAGIRHYQAPMHRRDLGDMVRARKILRGIIRDGYQVDKGMKIADIDPRKEEKKNCNTISDKARCIAGSVVEILLSEGVLPARETI